MFDDVLLLAKGRTVYCGPSESMQAYFSQLGFKCPLHSNLADYYLDLSSVDWRSASAEAQSTERVNMLVKSFEEKTSLDARQSVAANSPINDKSREMMSFVRSFLLLSRRSFTNLIRSRRMTRARFMQVTGFAVVLAFFYFPLGNSYYSIQNRIGLLYQLISPLLFTGLLNSVAVFPIERNVFYREYEDGVYSSTAFLFSYLVNEVPFEIVATLIYAMLAGPVIGLQFSPDRFFTLFFVSFCIVFSGESFGIIFCGIFYTIGFSVSVTAVLISGLSCMTGFISLQLPAFLVASNYISILKYACEVLAINEFTDINFDCTDAQKLPNGTCAYSNGDQVMDLFHFDPSTYWYSFYMIIVCTVSYRFIAFVIFHFVKKRFSQ